MFYDTDGNPLTAAALDIRSEQEKTLSVLIDCAANQKLRAETVPELAVLARHNSQEDFTDIETTPLALDEWGGNRELFVIKLSAGVIAASSQTVFNLNVKP